MEKQLKTPKFKGKYYEAVGRRKRSVARVRLYKGTGKVVVNDKEQDKINPTYIEPLELTGNTKQFDISVQVKGGGKVGQAEATRHGISRALLKVDENLRHTLKKESLLTRDPREKERKKPGLKGARRAPQWQKR